MENPVADLYRQPMGTQQRRQEMLSWIAYDTEQYTSASTVQLNFFRTVKSSKVTSNMEQAGSFPMPQVFQCYAIRIVPLIEPGALVTAAPNALTDIYRLLFNSYCEFKCGHMTFGIFPSFCLPAGAGIYAAAAAAGAEANDEIVLSVNNGIPDPKCVYSFEPTGHQIDPGQKFEFNMYWDSAVTLTGNQSIKVLLDGRLIRPQQ